MQFESVNYLEHPLSLDALKDLLRRAGLQPSDVIRTKEPTYRQLAAGKTLSENELLELMTRHPELLQRPLVVSGDRVVLARPLQNLSRLGI